EEKLRKIIDSSPDNITVTDLNGIIIDCNQAAADMIGFSTKEDIIGKNTLELIVLKDREKALEYLKKALEIGLVKNVEYTFLKKDGSEFQAEISASVIQDSSGKPLSFMAITKDITERKKAEKELKEKIDELERFKKLTVGREHKMIELKKEINELCKQMNQKPRYEGL
ncbi:MAG: PAS domain S-box protein, partial [Euryarchaeota archaeon]|nr:PAS domain S-box protein [Euryarchaeota archaeon]